VSTKTSAGALSLREEQKQLTRQRIRRAARALFFRNGYNNVTFEDIAAEAGIGRATLYLYFSNRSAILIELINQHLHETLRIYAELTNKPNISQRVVTAWLQSYIDEVIENASGVNLFHVDGALEEVVRSTLVQHRLAVIELLGTRFTSFNLGALKGGARRRRYCEADLMIGEIEGVCGAAAHPGFHLDVRIAVNVLSERFYSLLTLEPQKS